MFNLDQAIADWRQQMATRGIDSPAILDELENHVREDAALKLQSGLPEQEAFAAAVLQMGQPEVLRNEFTRARLTIAARLKHLIFILAGIPNPQLATNMNTHSLSNLEPRWATYLKTAAFVMPAVFLWIFSILLLVPKLHQISHEAGTSLFGFEHAPGAFRAFGLLGQGMLLLTENAFYVSGAMLLVLVLLEWRSSRWPRYRRAPGHRRFLPEFRRAGLPHPAGGHRHYRCVEPSSVQLEERYV